MTKIFLVTLHGAGMIILLVLPHIIDPVWPGPQNVSVPITSKKNQAAELLSKPW